MHEPSDASQANLSDVPALKKDESPQTQGGYARMLTCGIFFVVSAVGLGLLLGHDIAHYCGNRLVRSMTNDEGEGIPNPEYEAAEQEWANGQHLEAVRLMREYLSKNPREQHVALRIAEIYEKDLGNPLAAALEYEEILQQKLPPERWGWAAIHLCNLYSKLNQHEKSIALLQRIEAEYKDTAAAEKARKRLEELGLLAQPDAIQAEPSAAPAASTGPKLPPGFSLKKT